MPTARRRHLSCLVVGCLAAVSLGLLLAGGIVFLSARPGSLGPPSPDLAVGEQVGLEVYLTLRSAELNAPVGLPSHQTTLQVKAGMTASQVADALQQDGLIRDGTLLTLYMRYRGLDRGVQAGSYNLNGGMSVRQIAEALQSATAQAVHLTVPEGWRREQIAAALAQTQLAIPTDAFLKASGTWPPGTTDLAGGAQVDNLEGFLFPDTYLLDPGSTANQVVAAMVEDFDQRVTPDMRTAFKRQGLSLVQAVTMASIVEREAVVPDERPKIASVFLNRLQQGLNLDADPTIQFALGLQSNGSWWKTSLTAGDLAFDSPYNTYLYPGLPPGPICNPGLASLQAVAHPADTPYLYFRAACDGSGRHLFAQTYQQHLANACQ